MNFPETSEAFLAAVEEARSDFFHTYGDSATTLFVSPDLFQRVPDNHRISALTDDGVRRVLGLQLVLAEIPGHPMCVGLLHDPFVACEKCRGL